MPFTYLKSCAAVTATSVTLSKVDFLTKVFVVVLDKCAILFPKMYHENTIVTMVIVTTTRVVQTNTMTEL